VYLITGDGGNVVAYLTDEGVILVDSKNERNHDELVAKAKTLTDKPIKYVINTHAHTDHTGGNQKPWIGTSWFQGTGRLPTGRASSSGGRTLMSSSAA
jgi:glyoxylase-like metal-dependent hydrolase (beta-lactamase superfamily II)